MSISDRLTVVSNSLVGGSVVALLLKQRIRMKAIKGLYEFQAKKTGLSAPSMDNNSTIVVGVPVSVRLQETYTYQSDVTKHAVESGALMSDHVILHPVKVDLSFEVSNWDKGMSENALELLEAIHLSRVPIDLLTEHKKMSDMVMVSLQADNSVPQWGKLTFRATFQQLQFVTLQVVKYPKAKIKHTKNTGGPDTSKSAEAPKNNGQQKPRESALSKGARSLFGG